MCYSNYSSQCVLQLLCLKASWQQRQSRHDINAVPRSQSLDRMTTSLYRWFCLHIPSKQKKCHPDSKYMLPRTRPFFSTAISQQLLHGCIAQPCGSKPYSGRAFAGGIQWLKGMCSNNLARITVYFLMSNNICRPSTIVCLLSPASQSCSNDARGTCCAEQRKYTTRSRSRCRSQKTCQTVKAHATHPAWCERKRITDPSLGLPGVSKDGLHDVHPIEMHRQVLSGPGVSGKLVQVSCPVPGAWGQSSHHPHRHSTPPCHRNWCPALET